MSAVELSGLAISSQRLNEIVDLAKQAAAVAEQTRCRQRIEAELSLLPVGHPARIVLYRLVDLMTAPPEWEERCMTQ